MKIQGPLVRETIKNINQREEQNEDHFWFTDLYIKRASEKYNLNIDKISKSKNFIIELEIFLQDYQKEKFIDHFQEFIKNEIDLDIALKKHEAHFKHVIEVFFLGYNIITKWKYLLKKFKNAREKTFYEFRQFFFSWFACSLFHDLGYIIEEVKERLEKIKIALSKFGKYRYIFIRKKFRWENLYNLFKLLSNTSQISIEHFKQLFWIKHKCTWDHGLISANRYIDMLIEAKEDYDKKNPNNDMLFLEWRPNKYATIAMFLHNFKMIDFENLGFECNLHLSCENEYSIISYLLMVCDDIQEWGREKLIAKLYKDEGIKEILESIELTQCQFNDDGAFLVVNHNLKDIIFNDKYEKYMIQKRLKGIKKSFPVDIELNNYMNDDLRELEDKNDFDVDIKFITSSSHNDRILNPLNNENSYCIKVNHTIGKKLFAIVTYRL